MCYIVEGRSKGLLFMGGECAFQANQSFRSVLNWGRILR